MLIKTSPLELPDRDIQLTLIKGLQSLQELPVGVTVQDVETLINNIETQRQHSIFHSEWVSSTDEQKTDYVVKLAKTHGINVRSEDDRAVYFDMPQRPATGKTRPYFMVWKSRSSQNEAWGVEFGHWYTPKNARERKSHPTTEHPHYGELIAKIKKYADEIAAEAPEETT